MTADTPEFEFGAKFPESRSSSTRSSKSKTSSEPQKLPPVPRGIGNIPREEVILITQGDLHKDPDTFSMRETKVYNYDCPSDTCDFEVRRSFNKDGAYKTLQTHIQTDHRREKK